MAAACSTTCSSSKIDSVASPATIASWLPLKVVECTMARSIELKTLRKILSLDSMAATGT